MTETSREHSLFQELREARRKLGAAKVAEQDAKTVQSERKAARLKAEALIEEILAEIDTGKSGRPLIDAANARGGVEEAVGQAIGIMERACEAETKAVLAARKASRGGGKPKDDEEESKRVSLPDGDLVRQPGGSYAAEPAAAPQPVNVFKKGVAARLRPKPLWRFDVYERVDMEERGKLLGQVSAESSAKAAAILAGTLYLVSPSQYILSNRRPAPDATAEFVPALSEPPAADPPPAPAKGRGRRKKPPADGPVREPVIGGGGPNRQVEPGELRCENPDDPECRCPACLAVDPTLDLATRHWDVHRWHATNHENRGPRIGTQIARSLNEARRLADEGWRGTGPPVVVGNSHPHGPDCGCGTGPEPPAARKPDPHAAELAADTAKAKAGDREDPRWTVFRRDAATGLLGLRLGEVEGVNQAQAQSRAVHKFKEASASEIMVKRADTAAATDAVKLWAVHRYDDKAAKHRGDRIGSIRAVDRLEAAQLAAEVRNWTDGGVVLIGEELVEPGAKPVQNLGQLDHPESNRRVADRLIGRLAEKGNGKPHRPGPMNQDDALLQACDLPEVRAELGRLTAEGGSDNEILEALVKWPRLLKTYPDGTGNPWATIGGPDPRFFYDSDALDNWGSPRALSGATLQGDALVKAVRRNLHIPRPRPSKADGRPVRVRKPKGPKPAEAQP